MASSKIAATVNVFILTKIDMEKSWKLGLELAKEFKGILNGIYVFNLANPNRDAQYFSFVVGVDSINQLIEKLKNGLKLADENILSSVVPGFLPEEKAQPKDMVS
jgi:hypothetical protein